MYRQTNYPYVDGLLFIFFFFYWFLRSRFVIDMKRGTNTTQKKKNLHTYAYRYIKKISINHPLISFHLILYLIKKKNFFILHFCTCIWRISHYFFLFSFAKRTSFNVNFDILYPIRLFNKITYINFVRFIRKICQNNLRIVYKIKLLIKR